MSVIDTLITDRTEADVTIGNAKGTYNASDLNRVGAAMNYVADRLKAQGYDPHISPKTDWKDDDWVDPAAQDVYLGDLAELRKQFAMMASTPQVPADMEKLTWQEANAIEQILLDLESTIKTMLKTRVACGDAYCGGEYL